MVTTISASFSNSIHSSLLKSPSPFNKVNVFLSDDEKFILKRDSSKLNLSQSEYIRNLIIGYEIKIPEVKEEPKPKKDEYIIENIAKALEENIECLIKVKNKFHYLGTQTHKNYCL